MSGTQTNTDAMTGHGKQLTGEITSALAQAHQASTQNKLDDNVLGELGQVWAFIFNEEVAAAERMLRQLPKSMEANGHKVLDAANEFRNRDDAASSGFQGIQP
jgi:hypothetical protein